MITKTGFRNWNFLKQIMRQQTSWSTQCAMFAIVDCSIQFLQSEYSVMRTLPTP